MIGDDKRLEVTMHILRALDDIKQKVPPRNPQMFALMAEGYVNQLARLGEEIEGYLTVTKSAG